MSWYTSDEINFIDWLGTGTYTRQSPLTSHLGTDRLTLLKGYRAGISRRVDLGNPRPEEDRGSRQQPHPFPRTATL